MSNFYVRSNRDMKAVRISKRKEQSLIDINEFQMNLVEPTRKQRTKIGTVYGEYKEV